LSQEKPSGGRKGEAAEAAFGALSQGILALAAMIAHSVYYFKELKRRGKRLNAESAHWRIERF